jgi:hypothetical protein
VPNKEKMCYDAQFRNGTTVLDQYLGVEHPYQSMWCTVRLADDDFHATRHWVGAARPMLHYKPDRAYWIETGLVPPIDTTVAYTMNYVDDYMPCSSHSHRAGIDDAGGFMGRGIMPDSDCKAFAIQSAAYVRQARVNAFAGLHIPFHFTTNKLRQRPGDATADEANTINPQIMQDERGAATPASYSDFTADGMPVSAFANATGTGAAPYKDGWVSIGFEAFYGSISGTTLTVDPVYVPFTSLAVGNDISGWGGCVKGTRVTAVLSSSQYTVSISQAVPAGTLMAVNGARGGNSNWGSSGIYNGSGESSHAVSYSHYMALYDGERYFYNATISIAHRSIMCYYGEVHLKLQFTGWYPGSPNPSHSNRWTAIGGVAYYGTRPFAWHVLMLSTLSIVANDDVRAGYLNRVLEHDGDWVSQSYDYLPASSIGDMTAWVNYSAPWEHSAAIQTCMTMYNRTKNPAYLKPALEFAKRINHFVATNKIGLAQAYRAFARPKPGTQWNATDNDWHSDGFFFEEVAVSLNATTNVFTTSGAVHTVTNGDLVMPTNLSNASVISWPVGLVLGQRYYTVNSTSSTFQLSETLGGTPIDFTTNYSGALGIRYQSASINPPTSPRIPFSDSTFSITYAAAVLLRRHGAITQSVMDQYALYNSVINYTSVIDVAVWNLKA